ncbi:hypothetical protein [Azospirillum himalayense]|uniref:Uncharacterized protein n=1 Tax=Azospirillum himalayense TaxID=654847 RepID=A0ABW0FXH1_9PROT
MSINIDRERGDEIWSIADRLEKIAADVGPYEPMRDTENVAAQLRHTARWFFDRAALSAATGTGEA